MASLRDQGLLEAGDGPNLLFLHGWTMTGAVFADQIARLKDRFHCFAPDLPGHGAARGGPPASLERAIAETAALIENRIKDPLVIVGWSLGAMVAWHVLARYRGLDVRGLVTVDMSPKILNDAHWSLGIKGFTEERNRQATRSMAANWTDYAPRIRKGLFADTEGPSVFPAAKAAALIRQQDPNQMVAMWQSLCRADARAQIPTLGVPMLAIAGAKSRIYPTETALWIAENAPDTRLEIVAGCGHSPHLEDPARFANLVTEFARPGVFA